MKTDMSFTGLGYGDALRFGNLVCDRYGLFFPESRRSNLERGVRQAFAASTCASLDEYYDLLKNDESAFHTERLINALTVGETHFFRNTPQYDALYNHVLPEIIQRRQYLRSLRIWSAGCASGEEPYSIAMLLRELLPDVDQWSITILGTDINTEALDRARKGVYSDWAFREPRAKALRPRYFRQQGNHHELDPEVRRMVTFDLLNLAGNGYPAYDTNTMFMDLILCCNVMIYFPAEVIQATANRFYDTLADSGWLVIGQAEHSLTTFQRFQANNFPDTIIYRRMNYAAKPLPELKPAITPTQVVAEIPAQPQPLTPQVARPEEIKSLRVDDMLDQANNLLEYGHLEEARDLLIRAAGKHPEYITPASILLGRVYADLGDWLNAERWCQQAIQLNNLALEAYYTLALVLSHQGKLDQAVTMMKKVVYLDRHHVLGHFHLADLYHAQAQIPQALKALDNARRLLENLPAETLVPNSGGVTVERLQAAVLLQQQQWTTLSDPLPGDSFIKIEMDNEKSNDNSQ